MNIPKDLYNLEYMYRNIQITSNMNGYYEKRIDCNPDELDSIKHNHRRIFINEVIFDIDCHIRDITNSVADKISLNLQEDNLFHQVWDTSRSPHIHCFFKDLNLYPKEARRLIKLAILKEYSKENFKWIDKSKISENVLIRDFNSTHEVTNKTKSLVYEFQGFNSKSTTSLDGIALPEIHLNDIPLKILSKITEFYLKQEKMPKIEDMGVTEAFRKAIQSFLTYCMENEHIHDGREIILFREVAKSALLLYQNDTNSRHRIYHQIVKNCRGRHVNELIQWDKFFQKVQKQGKSLKIYFKELEKYRFYKVEA